MLFSWRLCACTQGEMAAMFLRHEGFLGAVGAFLKVHPMNSGAKSRRTQAPVNPERYPQEFQLSECLFKQDIFVKDAAQPWF